MRKPIPAACLSACDSAESRVVVPGESMAAAAVAWHPFGCLSWSLGGGGRWGGGRWGGVGGAGLAAASPVGGGGWADGWFGCWRAGGGGSHGWYRQMT